VSCGVHVSSKNCIKMFRCETRKDVTLRDMDVGRCLRYNKVVPIRAMGGDRLSGGIAPLIFKLFFYMTRARSQQIYS
jgi:hypothetical protein